MKGLFILLTVLSLNPRAFTELPLGDVRPEGWLREMMVSQKEGITAKLDELYPEVMGSRNGWLGGDGDQWERGPYWIDGLLPLAWQLDDSALKAKVQPWIEWTLASQREDGFFGPSKDYPAEFGLQRSNSRDWWPRMVMLKVMQQYYEATRDARVIDFLTRYFHYQLETLPSTPLGNWTDWAEFRRGDNMLVVYWLYGITHDEKLLSLGKILHEQGFDYVHMFLETDDLSNFDTIHGVNLAQGIKEPVVYWQQDGQQRYLDAVDKAIADLRRYDGYPTGMFSGDELLHGNDPTLGVELCSIIEYMYSLEQMLEITGNPKFAELLERVAFNALPTHIKSDFSARQYFQQVNQVEISRKLRNFEINHLQTDLLYGLLSGYPCCTANLHQGWPKFTRTLWTRSADGGLAALVYAPSTVKAKVGKAEITIREDTYYPMDEQVLFRISANRSERFSISFNVPSWAKDAKIRINGRECKGVVCGINRIERRWKDGDTVEILLPMSVKTQQWCDASVAVERGPLVYSLGLDAQWSKIQLNPLEGKGAFAWEVYTQSPWNYGLMYTVVEGKDVRVVKYPCSNNPWSLSAAPVQIHVKAKRIPTWGLYNGSAGPLPCSNMYFGPCAKGAPEEEIVLVPYGCTTLRITEFPVINQHSN